MKDCLSKERNSRNCENEIGEEQWAKGKSMRLNTLLGDQLFSYCEPPPSAGDERFCSDLTITMLPGVNYAATPHARASYCYCIMPTIVAQTATVGKDPKHRYDLISGLLLFISVLGTGSFEFPGQVPYPLN
ncbi:hypothetical protein M378DRAFT_459300 [Amanita muscaria Koide BX008]|uniref:Uncharacterized protein n=1 Tax=Amanita muscaria (strain Koide BX008) TaxID=946122 RepID=A0A0C2WVE0_AMAMK|nr:hypothetical protein M378DRAFT_459300 [Amanita muscaria Koide BX008]